MGEQDILCPRIHRTFGGTLSKAIIYTRTVLIDGFEPFVINDPAEEGDYYRITLGNSETSVTYGELSNIKDAIEEVLRNGQ